jgi:predicted site-specific integrase-resolvase
MMYARVATAGQQPDLVHQVAALRASCARRGERPDAWIEGLAVG